MKKLLLASILSAFSIFNSEQVNAETVSIDEYETQFITTEQCDRLNPNYCNNPLTNGLETNQTTLFYMYSNENGHYFIDPLAGEENVIYVGLDDYKFIPELKIDVDNLHHGQRFIGTFVDDTLWELLELEAVQYSEVEEN